MSKKGNSSRSGLAPSPWKGIRAKDNAYEIDAWHLDAPSIEYSADRADARMRDGAVCLSFYQLDLSEQELLTAVAITMGRTDFLHFLESFEPVLQRTYEKQGGDLSNRSTRSIPPGKLDSSSFKRFMASLARGGTRDGLGLIDFYRLSILHPDQLASEQDPAKGVLRVLMFPRTFCELIESCRLLKGEVAK